MIDVACFLSCRRSQVSQTCFDGFYRLTEIRRCERLDQLKTLSLFPTEPMLEEIENKYGDVVSLVDMNGAAEFSLNAGVSQSHGSLQAGSQGTVLSSQLEQRYRARP